MSRTVVKLKSNSLTLLLKKRFKASLFLGEDTGSMVNPCVKTKCTEFDEGNHSSSADQRHPLFLIPFLRVHPQ